jgi:FkbM family methyltransferase
VHRDLVFDIGLHDGRDTAYYLHRGFRVVAVDANPLFCDAARERFAGAVRDGRLTVLNLGIHRRRGAMTFWLNPVKTDWSSFDRGLVTRAGHPAEPVEVPCVPMADLLAEHGVPWYLKADIEGFDTLCVEALRRDDLPEFVSVEACRVEFLAALSAAGYNAFRAVSQVAFPPDAVTGWAFEPGSSGPLPDEASAPPGSRPWRLFREVALDLIHAETGQWDRTSLDRNAWYDLHATRLEGFDAVPGLAPMPA